MTASRIILIVSLLIGILFCLSACNKEPEVKATPKEPEVEKPIEPPATPDDYDKIVQNLPSNTVEINRDTPTIVEGTINPVNYQANFAMILNKAMASDFKIDDYNALEKLNNLIKEHNQNVDMFKMDEDIVVDKVIWLDKFHVEADDVGEKYSDEVKKLEHGHWVFFLFEDEFEKDKINLFSSYAGFVLEAPDKYGLDKLRALPGVLFENENSYIVRAATSKPRYFKNRPSNPDN